MEYPNREFNYLKQIGKSGVRKVPPYYIRLVEAEKENHNTVVVMLSGAGTYSEYHAYGASGEFLHGAIAGSYWQADNFAKSPKLVICESLSKIKTVCMDAGKGLMGFTITGHVVINEVAPIVVKKPDPLAIPQKIVGSAIVPKNFWSTHILPKTENKIDVPTDFDESEAVELPIQSAIFDGVVYTSGQAYTKSGKLKKGFKPLADMEIVENVDFSTFKIPSRSCAVVHDVIEQPAMPPAFNPGGWYMPAPPQEVVEESQQKVVGFNVGDAVKIEGLCQEGVICGFSGEWWKVSYSIGSHPMVAWRKFNDIQEVE
jgi:hypothetical protein